MLTVHRSERADGLAERLAALLHDPLEDPMQAEVVSVPTRGVERWLTQRLAHVLGAGTGRGDGVCANIDFPFPGRLVGGAAAAATGVDREADPWRPERAVWPLLEVVDDSLREPWLAALAAYLGGEGDATRRARRLGAARHVADLYDRYAVHRPAMLRAWAGREDVTGAGEPLPAGAAWQAELWRRLRARLGVPSLAERLEGACARLRGEPSLVDLPRRISLFGLTRLPASYLDILAALAEARDVHLFLLHPSPALWDRVADVTGGRATLVRRAEDPTAELARSPLLASWGRDSREIQVVLGGLEHRDDHRAVEEPATTLLARLQADVRADRAPAGLPPPGEPDLRPRLDVDDRSVQVHACHGRARQVEVIRDAILHLLAEDPLLEPRDVIVMCPDIEAFAPLVQATFGATDVENGEAGGPRPPDLRVRLADRSLRQTNPVLGVVSELLELASARVTAAQVLDLASREPVCRRFGFDEDDLARLEDWVAATGIRWGLDAAHRAPFRLDDLPDNTWRAGLDRLLVGVTMADVDQRLVGGVLPLDDVESGAIDLAGRFAELVDRLAQALDDLTADQPVEGWADAIAGAAHRLTAVDEPDAWQRGQLDALLEDVRAEADTGGSSSTLLSLAEVRGLMRHRLRGQPTRANFRTGHLTVCTLVPMRSVPHRVVCLLGLDDGIFPRRTERDGDDVILADPVVGDADRRGEDRQLLLDALMAATDHLVVTYTGRDERTNAARPPAVPVGELLDVIDRTVRIDGVDSLGAPVPARAGVLIRHPLQPFDPRNFAPDALTPGRSWSFDPVALDGARALVGPRADPPPLLSGPLPPAGGEVVELDALQRFLRHPVRAFLRRRLGVSLSEREDEVVDGLPVELDALERWGVGHRLLTARLAGAELDACLAAERARGGLPPGALAESILAGIAETVDGLVAAAGRHLGAGPPTAAEIDLPLPAGRRLVGSVDGVRGSRVGLVIFSRVGPAQRLAAWVRFLALAASREGEPVEGVTIGRLRQGGKRGCRLTIARLAAVPSGVALGHLTALVDLLAEGMREPLPLLLATSAAYAAALRSGRDAAAAGRGAWESGWEWPGEDQDPEHRLVFGGVVGFDDLLAMAGGRFEACAARLWEPPLDLESITDE